jgi:hypothetical protein
MTKTMNRAMRLFAILDLLLLVTGCASNQPASDASSLTPVEAALDVPPKQALETIRQHLEPASPGPGVESVDGGAIVTGYERFPGEWHIARRWQERTRYRVSVIPDWQDPTGKCRVQVNEETQVRHADGQEWRNEPDLVRRERAEKMLQRVRGVVMKR